MTDELGQSPTQPARLPASRVTIAGLGLMGGSLALALRGRCASLTGVDQDPAALESARARGVVDFATPDLRSGLIACDLLILAVPARAILGLLNDLPNNYPTDPARPPLAVLDLGSTKSAIVAAMQALPAQFDPIGGHPMCGRESAGLAHADGGLFQGQVFALVPLARTSAAAHGLARELIEAIGARAVELTAARHDALTAAISHLPYTAAAALVLAAEGAGDAAAWQLAASGFRDATRLAASDLTMMVDILLTNRAAILEALGRYQAELDGLRALIEAGDAAALRRALAPAQARRKALFQ